MRPVLLSLIATAVSPDRHRPIRWPASQDVVQNPVAADFFVSPRGKDTWSGKLADPGKDDGPFATVARAREAVRALLKTLDRPATRPRRPACRDVLPRLAAGVRARGFRDPERSRGLCRGGGREGHPERGTPPPGRSLGRGQRPQGMDGGPPRGEGRELAVPATLRRRRAPAADEAAEARGVPDRIAAGLYRRLPPEPDQAVRLRRGRHRARLAQPPGRGGRRDHEVAGQPAADRERRREVAHRHLRPPEPVRPPLRRQARALLGGERLRGPRHARPVVSRSPAGDALLPAATGGGDAVGRDHRPAAVAGDSGGRACGRPGPRPPLRGPHLRPHGMAAAGRLCLVAPGRDRSARRLAVRLRRAMRRHRRRHRAHRQLRRRGGRGLLGHRDQPQPDHGYRRGGGPHRPLLLLGDRRLGPTDRAGDRCGRPPCRRARTAGGSRWPTTRSPICGRFTPEAVGVFVGDNAECKIVHNHIHDLFYSGISVGSVQDFGPCEATGNIIEYNHVHDIGQGMLSDLAGIYTCSTPKSRIAFNVVHDVTRRDYGGWGIYPDEGSPRPADPAEPRLPLPGRGPVRAPQPRHHGGEQHLRLESAAPSSSAAASAGSS